MALSTPATNELVERIQSLSPQLWDRQPDHPDFLQVRVGTGDVPAPEQIEVREGGADELVAKALELRNEFSIDRGVPVSVSLLGEPVVAVVSQDPEVGRAVVRAMVVQVVARDSPNDVRLAAIGGSGLGMDVVASTCGAVL